MDELAVNCPGKKRMINEDSSEHPAEKVMKIEEEEEIATTNINDANGQQPAVKAVKVSVVRQSSDPSDVVAELRIRPVVRQLLVQPRVFGLVATAPVEAGAYVAELLGQVCRERECPNRDLVPGSLNDHTFLMEKDGVKYLIDARQSQDATKCLRRSCKPNAKLEVVQCGLQLHVMIKATKALEKHGVDQAGGRLASGAAAGAGMRVRCACDSNMQAAIDCELQRFFLNKRANNEDSNELPAEKAVKVEEEVSERATINNEDSNELPEETTVKIEKEDENEEPLSSTSPPHHSQPLIELQKKVDTAAAAASAAAAATAPSADSGEESDSEKWEISCICGTKADDGEEMVQCDQCILRWEHVDCIFPRTKKVPSGNYFCHVCKPRPTELTREQARAYQDRVIMEKQLAKERLEKRKRAAAAKRKE
ncbi:hypothetical protein PRIPAC_85779 [Pristionchus pacificus]|uniref:PHD finger motif containing protein n=1 Tax=Pristionchus pacificus TaxID=54126 RepID=A0A2A6BL02_PRIPA|nr:hypothetical protein PRIPAC_85779 [Pristionchus pacificus]|eukprot:PDM66595.1 PHD finger motif containing protein [Pristionchus pacificus]